MIEDVRRFVCDRCKSEIIVSQNDSIYENPKDWVNGVFYPDFTIDLCPKCSELHERFMNGYAVDGEEFTETR